MEKEKPTNIEPTDTPSEIVNMMRWRSIGPYRGGRSVAVAGDPNNQMTFYFGACTGGIWKTEDGGIIWENVSDGFFNTASVGAIAVSDSDPNVIYVGMGEACIRGNVSHGDGVYKSTDKGLTWEHVGLEDTRHIARIQIHPKNPDIVYVAAFGNAFGQNPERGIYRSIDGGQSWELILFKSNKAGAIDLSIDPSNPRVIYAATYEALRKPWHFSDGGPDSCLYKSIDGGENWDEINHNHGIPIGIKGRIGIAISPANPNRVWAIIESKDEGGIYRSDDDGKSWHKISDDKNVQARSWYFNHIFADPKDPNTLYVLSLKMWKSTDAGKTFVEIPTPHGDQHGLWIDPNNPLRMIEGNDGGACVSFDGGESWSSIYNQPTAQFYRMSADNQFPYRVYATQQDNTAISVPSRSSKSSILWSDCYIVGNSESGQIAVKPNNPDIVYSGAVGSTAGGGDMLLRYDHSNNQIRDVSVWPEVFWEGVKGHKYRFQWTYPIVISDHDPNTIYVAANVIFRSVNDGNSWEIMSKDLTRCDVTKMEDSGGPINLDMTYVEHYGTIFALTESVFEADTLWVGSDDGLVHITRDLGKNWENITPEELPEWTLISMIEPSKHNPATAYLVGTRYKLNDLQPYLYKTNDYGKTWTKITDGIPKHDFTRVIREDPIKEGLLYVGTETGVYVSFNQGSSWQPLNSRNSAKSMHSLPVVPVHDMKIKDDELVVATHGRAFWILDNLSLIREIPVDLSQRKPYLFKPSSVYRVTPAMDFGQPPSVTGRQYSQSTGAPSIFRTSKTSEGEMVNTFLNAGTNPPPGVTITYYINHKPESELSLSIINSDCQTIRRFVSKIDRADSNKTDEPNCLSAKVGINRLQWDLRHNGPKLSVESGELDKNTGPAGPLVTPGTYEVKMKFDSYELSEKFDVLIDPRITSSQSDLDDQLKLLLKIRDKISEIRSTVENIRNVRKQIEEWEERSKKSHTHGIVLELANTVKNKLSRIENELEQPEFDSRIYAKLDSKFLSLHNVVSTGDYAPTQQSKEVLQDISNRADEQITNARNVFKEDVEKFVSLIHELNIPTISTS